MQTMQLYVWLLDLRKQIILYHLKIRGQINASWKYCPSKF